MFHKILIANRGEIAVRVIRACKELGVATVAVYSTADSGALHVRLADEAVCIGPAPVTDSYLNMVNILSAAVATGADAIHPGYGLLSENARFAKLCGDCGITFIGPGPELIEKLGDKEKARSTMQAAGVPVIPGAPLVTSSRMAHKYAKQIGLPLLIKARAGGGGRGIRRVDRMQDIPTAFAAASAEAKAAFGDGACYMERLLTRVKHVEMQIICDDHGGVLCLGERDCSVQRNNQKLLEESPSPAVSPGLRKRMMRAAVSAAKAVKYRSLGTIEFLVDEEGQFYFMEMNTRLQVEHPVTEMVTGMDIVKWQIKVAAGQPLDRRQADVALTGHAVECRINAEDPKNGFLPSCGRVSRLQVPGGFGVRFDSALYQGYLVPPYYDSMLGKLICHGATRDEALRKMRGALDELQVDGVKTTAGLHLEILDAPAFLEGTYTTDFLNRRMPNE